MPVAGIAALGLLILGLPKGADSPARPASLTAIADPSARETVDLDVPFQWDPTPQPGGGATFERGTLRDLQGAVTVLVFADSPSQLGKIEAYASAGLQTVISVSPGDGGEATRLHSPDAAYATASDTDGALARSLGVTSRPTIVVLDKAARVALRTPGAPSLGAPTSPTDIRAALASLRAEPVPAAVTAPRAPSVWFLAGAPLAPSAVPAVVSSSFCRVLPSRVWEFGPTVRGWRVFIGAAAVGPAVRELVFTTTDPAGRPAHGGLDCGVHPDFARRARALPAIEVFQGKHADGTSDRIYLVRRGFARAVAGGRTFLVINGTLSLSGPLPATFTLVGPAGRRTVGVDVGLG